MNQKIDVHNFKKRHENFGEEEKDMSDHDTSNLMVM